MCTRELHEKIKDDPAAVITATQNPRPWHDEDGVVIGIQRECSSCASSLCLTPEQELAAQRVRFATP